MRLLILLCTLTVGLSQALLSAELRIYSTDRREFRQRQITPVSSLCEDTPAGADFVFFFTPSCFQLPANFGLLLVSADWNSRTDWEIVLIPATDLVNQWEGEKWGWEITLPAGKTLLDVNRTLFAIETETLPCSGEEIFIHKP